MSAVVSQREAAGRLGVQPATVRSLVHRGHLETARSAVGLAPIVLPSLEKLIAEREAKNAAT